MLALVLVERDPVQARQLLDEASEIAAPIRDRFPPLRIQLIRARVEIELARLVRRPDRRRRRSARCSTSSPEPATSPAAGSSSPWLRYLLVHRPAADVATVVGIFEARHVENNRRQWLAGVDRARAELGDDTFDALVGQGAELNDDEAIAFLCGNP